MRTCVGSYQAYSPAFAYQVNVGCRLSSESLLRRKQACRPRCERTQEVPKKLVTPAGNKPPLIVHKTLKFYPSQTGRLIVVGDVHGCAVELAELLLKLQYDAGVDKLIFVGDLVNKGPRSRQVVQIAMQAGAHAVRGNHEEIALSLHDKLKTKREHKSWVNALSADELSFIAELPFTVSIPSLNLLIVHAGMVPNVPKQQQSWRNLCTMRNVFELMHDPAGDPSQTKYKAIDYHRAGTRPSYILKWASLWKGPHHILFGHDAQQGLQQCTHATGLDTGCVYGGSLTACVISIPDGIEAVSKLQSDTPPTLNDLGAELVSVPARKAYQKIS